MGKKAQPRVKHVPQRTCVGCRQTLAKRSLIRLVRSGEGVVVDPDRETNRKGCLPAQCPFMLGGWFKRSAGACPENRVV